MNAEVDEWRRKSLHVLHTEWSVAGWRIGYFVDGEGEVSWHARIRTMTPGQWIEAPDPVGLHEQIKLYPVRVFR